MVKFLHVYYYKGKRAERIFVSLGSNTISKPGWSSNIKHYIQEDLILTLPSYKHPKSMRASHIEIVFDLNVYTRAHFSLRAKITSNSNFYRYVTSTIHSCFLPLTKRQQPRNVWSFTYFARKKVYLLVSLSNKLCATQFSSCFTEQSLMFNWLFKHKKWSLICKDYC